MQRQARTEKVWKHLDPPRQLNYTAAAEDQWAKWASNDAVSILLETESADVEARLKEEGKSDYILSTRWVQGWSSTVATQGGATRSPTFVWTLPARRTTER